LKTQIESIRTGGQTGIDEAGAKAGINLSLPTTILAPKGWTFRDISGQDISNEQQFKARFVKKTGTNNTIEVDEDPRVVELDRKIAEATELISAGKATSETFAEIRKYHQERGKLVKELKYNNC
jgi:hypothetical protein